MLANMFSKQLTSDQNIPSPKDYRAEIQPKRPSTSRNTDAEKELPSIDNVNVRVGAITGNWNAVKPVGTQRYRSSNWEPRTRVEEERDDEVGQRGEELVFLLEKKRVKELGYDISRVIWTSRDDLGSDYDILSVDDNGQDLWIEVKSTSGTHGHFRWSKGEFEKAVRERNQYILLRVYQADTVHPVAVPFRDPVGQLLAGDMHLDIANLNAQVEPLGN